MDFVHDPYIPDETIAAIATPPGEGGVAIIRISGKDALQVAAKVFSGSVDQYKTHTAHYGKIINEFGKSVDNVLLLPMLGKRSYTGEDTVEIHCHGGSLISRRVLEVVIKAGARLAKPGEFTFKAYMNGKLDLAQAEAVQELIAARNEHALDAAENKLQGRLSKKVQSLQQQITHLTAILEAWVDFPEEGLEFATREEMCASLLHVVQEMQTLADTFHDGRIIHDGVTVCLIGSPNVGKSSLMNALLDKERAIVSHIPGTTRDTLEDHFRWNGLNFKLVDTAGIRDSNELIENEGIKRSKSAMESSDLILLVLDITQDLSDADHQLIQKVSPEKTIVIWNKTDLRVSAKAHLNFPHVCEISAKEKWGLDNLRAKIDEVIWKKGPPTKEEILITSVRHREALLNAISCCHTVVNGLNDEVSPEFLVQDIRDSLRHLGKIIGTNVSEDVLSAIFSHFCIGK